MLNNYRYKWRYADNERPKGCCYDCRMKYSEFPDMVIKDELWELINPTTHEGSGILCPTCIANRLNYIDKWYSGFCNFKYERSMDIKNNNYQKVKLWVDKMAKTPVNRFRPSAVAKELSLPVATAIEILFELVSEGKLLALWEVICPECYSSCDKHEHLDKNHFLDQGLTCVLGHDFVADEGDVRLIFEIKRDT